MTAGPPLNVHHLCLRSAEEKLYTCVCLIILLDNIRIIQMLAVDKYRHPNLPTSGSGRLQLTLHNWYYRVGKLIGSVG